jgi:hypothetical protein
MGGGGDLNIAGGGFASGATVTLDGIAAVVTTLNSGFIRATAPLHAAATVDLVVTNPGGESARLSGAYQYVPLEITAVTPPGALVGEVIRIAGTGFVSGSQVTLGGVTATVAGSPSATVISVQVPAHDPAVVDVVVTNPSGERATLANGFAYSVVSISANPSAVAPGSPLTVNWTAPNGRSTLGGGDWIALRRVGDPENASGGFWFAHLDGASSGSLVLGAPAQPGEYEFRYMVEATAVARTRPVTVTGGGQAADSAFASLSIRRNLARGK